MAADGTAVASVTKGKAEIGETNAVVVKEGRTGTVGDGQVAIAKFDKDKRDDFAQWSRDRSKELVKINNSLSDRNLDSALARGFRAGWWSLRDSLGLWIYDYRSGGYCFMPYGFNWRSPYGSWYGNGIYPWYVPMGPVRNGKGGRTLRNPVAAPPTGSSPIARVKGGGTVRSQTVDPLPITKVGRGSSGNVFTKQSALDGSFDPFPSTGRSSMPSAPSSPAPISIAPLSRTKGN